MKRYTKAEVAMQPQALEWVKASDAAALIEGRAMAVREAVMRARRDWAAQASPEIKAEWQAEALEVAAEDDWSAQDMFLRAAQLRRQAEGNQ